MPEYKYNALRVRQTATGDYLVLFAAPATEIDMWAGIPQKKELSEQEETTGFQREENPKRVRELKQFYEDEKNIIQNPLLGARRETTVGDAVFEPAPSATEPMEHGEILISVDSLEELSLLQLLKLVKRDLERRVSTLQGLEPPESHVLDIKQRASIPVSSNEDVEASEAEEETQSESEAEEDVSDEDDVAAVILDESHILEFWEQIAARVKVLEELKAAGEEFLGNDFLGFTKDAMFAFLRPVVLVDGQHRLRGAIEAALSLTNEDQFQSQIETRILNGEDAATVQMDIEAKVSRNLPISLLMSNDPAEQVFQFVVVNQKAVPIAKALLGTIVSTSLSNEELERVSTRLENAGIKLEESRVVAYLTRHEGSPFCGLVEKGLTADSKDLLPWSVLRALVNIFQRLEGGRLFHSKIDYAAKWRRDFLGESGIITDFQTSGFDTAYEFWRSTDGPWRDVFISFWKSVRDKLADTSDSEAKNYWGAARSSQLFNKISLTILGADFFQYLCDSKTTIEGVDKIPEIVDEWLDGVSDRYFARDWNLSGVKKDSTGIRNRWSKVWVEYRKDPVRLPTTSEYRKLASAD